MTDIVADGAAVLPSANPPTSTIQPNMPGRLAGTVTLALHTQLGVGVLLGRRERTQDSTEEGINDADAIKRSHRQPILGINRFAQALGRVMEAKAHDDIYAIQTLTEIDDLMAKAEEILTNERQWLAKKMNANPRMSVQIAHSIQPRMFELDLRSPYAHWAARLIGLYDELAAAALSARRAGIITDLDLTAILNNPRRAIRSSFYKAVRFKATGVTLDDVVQANGRAVDAIAAHGEISPNIVSGDRRPNYLH